ncbi:uncharacterized protein N7500_003161 [Penicillium coprophilum]|uniref:uncharacterized protein n=1 Tax=Penicillium coprophilum TaxID=36646 RepID=UPI0023A3E525|nr:uncharacterized protein N7500_003161 [Penicillium coprophilum]KAJ5170378.1 hypothetical protein N7500_003161 [Penicillium coprophilum]
MPREMTEKRREQNRRAQRSYRNNMKSRIEELERDNSFLLQQTEFSIPSQFTRPIISRGSGLSSRQPEEWDTNGELGSTVLENISLQNDSLFNPEKLDSTPVHKDPKFQSPITMGGGRVYYHPYIDPSHRSGTWAVKLIRAQINEVRINRRPGSARHATNPDLEEAAHEIKLSHTTTKSSVTPSGTTALHLAAASKNAQCVEILLEHGFDIDSLGINGRTALMAAAVDSSDVIRTLLDRGADLSIYAPDGKTALEIAAHLGKPKALTTLLIASTV